MKTVFSSAAIVAAILFAAPAQAQNSANAPNLLSTHMARAGQSAGEISSQPGDPLVAALVSLLQEAVITRLQADVSLQSLKVRSGKIQLRGVVIKNLDVGLKLKSRAARNAATNLEKAQLVPGKWAPVLQILKLGFFTDIELGVKLKELRLRELDVDAENLKLENAFLSAKLSPNERGKVPLQTDDLQTLLHFLSGIAPTRIEAHAGIGTLAASNLKIQLAGFALEGFWVGLALNRDQETKSS